MRTSDLAYLLLGWVVLRRSDVMTSLEHTALTWPVSVLDDDGKPSGRGTSRITQEYRPPTHMGVDIAVPGHYQDARAVVLALAPGKVVRAERTARGWQVLLDHGDWASGYLHLTGLTPELADNLRVAAQNPAASAGGVWVAAGEQLGPMGADPTDPERVVHLHLQIAPGGQTTDPAPYLKRAA